MAGEQRVLELRHHRVLVARTPLKSGSPAATFSIACSRTSCLTGRDTQPDALSAPSVVGRSSPCGGHVAMRRTYPGVPADGHAGTRSPGATAHLATLSSMSARGDWVATEADDDVRRHGIGLDADDHDWTPVAVPGHWRDTPKFATSDGPLMYRHRFTSEPPARAAGGG